jgi:hypothetical protein
MHWDASEYTCTHLKHIHHTHKHTHTTYEGARRGRIRRQPRVDAAQLSAGQGIQEGENEAQEQADLWQDRHRLQDAQQDQVRITKFE